MGSGAKVVLPEDTKLVARNGTETPVEVNASPIVGTGERVIGLVLVALDITQRRRAEEALRRSERLLALKNQIASIFLTIADDEMFSAVLKTVQREIGSAYGLFGYVDEDGTLVVPSLSREVWKECRVACKAVRFPAGSWAGLWGKALREQKSFHGNSGFYLPEGHVAINNFLVCPILYRQKTVGLIALANKWNDFDAEDLVLLEAIAGRIAPILQARLERDRIERERGAAEEALRRSERLLRSVFDGIPDLFSIIDRDYRIVLSNWHGGYEYVPTEVRENNPHCYVAYHDGSAPCSPCYTEEVFRTGSAVLHEKYNPKVGHVEVQAFPIFDEKGEVVLVTEHVRNITERKRAAEELSMEKERLAVTLRSIGDGVITTDTEGRVVLLNKVAEALTGWKMEEALGKPFQEVFHIVNEKNLEICPNPVDQVLATGLIVELANHTILVSRDGRKRMITDSGAPIRDRESRLVGVVLVFRDITDKRRMEEELFSAQKLESIGLLAGGIAHDFNNLLTVILGNISLSKVLAPVGEKIHKKLCEAEKASLRARDLTQQLLTFSRGGAPVRKTEAIGIIVRESAEFTLSGSQATCRFTIPEDLYPVDVDAGQFSQVINNLVMNADQAMPDGGKIEIVCSNVRINCDDCLPLPDGAYVRIIIRDQGGGIPADAIQRVFDPYFSTKASGKGLGLTTVYSILKNHDGHITVTSRLGEGTEFRIYLPAAVSGVVPSAAEETPLATGKGRILVMDDEEKIREIVGEMLGFLGFEAEFARDGEEVLWQYRRAQEELRPFAAVLMDLTIPGGMGGKDAIQRLLGLDAEARGIVSSGYSNDPVMADYRAYGFSGVITKPYKFAELRKVLHEVVGQCRP